ncbi:hypothetical protein NHX12_025046 [Muraenolepis orangiensis]|uniref:SKICH domain-containing protein n=1 Tax=Muraenolepis orangiensis TaxID=630683 RepID=A0A9Q0EIK6_9TELE|nr:hypothetical protein NHX12_025046 [Muraenolepis orangiensis]
MASPSTFSQVTFIDIPKTYIGSAPVTCHYTLAVGFQPTTRDWIGLFKVGWSTTKDYYNFVWVDLPVDLVEKEPARKLSLFCDYYLPKDVSDFYQFCYVDRAGHVKGASTPFSFRPPAENTEDSLITALLVVTTQDEMDERAQEREELKEALERLRLGSRSVERALGEKEQEVDCLKELNKERDRKELELLEELNQARKHNDSMVLLLKDKGLEADQLMEEILIQAKNHLEQHNARETETPETNTASEAEIQEKYDQAVVQINQLKAELAQQRERNTKSEEMAKLKLKVRGKEKEEEEEKLIKLRDSIQLLRVDLKCSERDKERLSAELDQLKLQLLDKEQLRRENQELTKSLSQQEARHNHPHLDYEAQCNTLMGQLENARTQLANERKESNDNRSYMEKQLLDAKEQLHEAAMENDRIQQKSIQLKSRLVESHEIIAEKDAEITEINGIIELRENRLKIHNQEREQLVQENQSRLAKSHEVILGKDAAIAELHGIIELRENRLKIQNQEKEELVQEYQRVRINVEDLHRELEDLQAAGCPSPQDTGRDPNTQEKRMVCPICQVRLPGVTQEELLQHEQSHRLCPFCSLNCDSMEQAQYEEHVYGHQE